MLEFCVHCVIGKKRKVKFGTAIHRTEGILDYIHTDILGPIKTTSLRGIYYFVSFIDDFYRCCWVYSMRYKGKVPDFFCGVVEIYGEHTGRKIKKFCPENGGEYISNHFL